MSLSRIDESLLLAAWFRDGRSDYGEYGTANVNQVLTLSLFYTGDMTAEECALRFSRRSYVGGVYDAKGQLTDEIMDRDRSLQQLIAKHPDLMAGGGHPRSEPTYRECGLTAAGVELAQTLNVRFPAKPDFPNWPDKHPRPSP